MTARIYFDNNATTRIWPEVAEVMTDAWQTAFANPGSQHSFGRDARPVLENCRESIASALGADPTELIFTSGGTESINAAVYGLTLGRKGTIALTDGEHPATTAACERARQNGMRIASIQVDGAGRLLPESLRNLDWANVKLVCLILAHNETGVIQDTSLVADLCEQNRVPLLLDAVQAVGKIPVDFRQLRATALAFGAHKFHGPRGVGGLLLRRGVQLPPFLDGGHQEAGRRAGTEAVPLIAGMSKALQHFTDDVGANMESVRRLRDLLEVRLSDSCDPVVIHGQEAQRLPNTLSIAFPGVDGEALLVNLDLESVACSLGSTCASGSAEPAPALLAMGCAADICNSSVRFSLSTMNTQEEVESAAERICKVVARLRSHSA